MDFYKYYILGWEGGEQNKHIYLHRFTNYLRKFMNQGNEPIRIMQLWKLTTTKSSSNNCGLGKKKKKVAHMVNNSPALQETRVRSLGREESLEKGMETHSRILAWSIPQTEEPGRLQSIGWLTVPQDWVNDTTENKAQPKDNYTCDRNVGSRKKSSPFPRWLSLWKSLSRVWPEPVWLLCPWDSPDKNTAVGNHSLLQESLPQELPGSTTLKAGSLSHQGNSNQQKKKKEKKRKKRKRKEKKNKPVCQYPRPGFRPWGAKNLAGLFAQPCPIGHPVFPWKTPWWFYGHWASLVSQLEKNLPTMWETWVPSLGWEDPSKRGRLTTPVVRPGKFHGLHST